MQFAHQGGFIQTLGQFEAAAGEIECCDAEVVATGFCLDAGAYGGNQVVAVSIEQGFVGKSAGCNDTYDFAFHRAFGGCRIADLLADGDGDTQPDQLRKIGVDGMIGHTAHGDRLSRGSAPGGQGDVEQVCGLLRIVIEQLVEIAHAIEKQFILVLSLDRQVLLHHGCVLPGCLAGRGFVQGGFGTGSGRNREILREFPGKKKSAWRFESTVDNTV